MQTILVLGGTGLLGTPVAQQLHQADGFTVRVMARDTDKAQQQLGYGFEIVQGDVTNISNLENAMTGCDGVHISIGGSADQMSAENVAALAPKLGVKRITYISGASVRDENGWFPMTHQKLMAEKAIRKSGVDYTVFCPNWPFEMLARYARNGEPFLIGDSFAPIAFFAATDLAQMVSSVYQTDIAIGKRLFIHGPEAITFPDALRRYCNVLHPDAGEIQIMPLEVARNIAAQTENKMLEFAAALMAYFESVDDYGDPAEANALLGAPQTTLDAWLEQVRV